MNNIILVYDDDCPFCCWYSRQFVRFGYLPENGRKAFSSLESSLFNQIDVEKSRNEIPLINTTTGKVVYGKETFHLLNGFLKNYTN